MVLGFARWVAKEGAKKLLKSEKGGVEAVSAIKPGTKFQGQKTVSQVQLDAAKSKLKMAKEKLKQTFKQTDKSLKKFGQTVKKQKKILED